MRECQPSVHLEDILVISQSATPVTCPGSPGLDKIRDPEITRTSALLAEGHLKS